MPDLSLETRLARDGHRCIAGIDEVGRGPLAGPVVAAAVVLDPLSVPDGLDDSKMLKGRVREDLAGRLRRVAHVGVGIATVEEIDEINILQASFLAMRRAIGALPVHPDYLLVDGNRLPADLPCPARPVIRGDSLSSSIAAASIVAKVTRDAGMVDLAQQYPGYGWDRNMGYGTRDHMLGLKCHGVTPHHRRSFAPIRKMLYQEK